MSVSVITKSVKITPKIHLLNGLRNADHWNYTKAISELVDNSFGPAAGDASHVEITIGKNYITIEDDGVGVDLIERLFTLGDSQSRYSRSDIGSYGQGAKSACIWMCDQMFVETRREGRRTKASMNWKKLISDEPDEFPELKKEVEVISEDVPTGTRIHLRGFAHKKVIHTDAICRALGDTYAMGIKSGKSITVVDERTKDARRMTVEAYSPTGLSDIKKVSGQIEGKRYVAEVGILSEQVGGSGGIRFCYGHRTIENKTILNGRAIPARIFGYVMLQPEWKENLSTNKTELIDSEDLEKDLMKRYSGVFDLAHQYHRDFIIEDLNAALSKSLTDILRSDSKGFEKGSLLLMNGASDTDGTDGTSNTRLLNKEVDEVKAPAIKDRINKDKGINIRVSKNGRDSSIGRIELEEAGLLVELNDDSPLMNKIIEDALKQRRHTATYVQMIGLIIVTYSVARGRDYCIKVFGSNRIGDSFTEKELIDKLLVWWSCEATKQYWIEKD